MTEEKPLDSRQGHSGMTGAGLERPYQRGVEGAALKRIPHGAVRPVFFREEEHFRRFVKDVVHADDELEVFPYRVFESKAEGEEVVLLDLLVAVVEVVADVARLGEGG